MKHVRISPKIKNILVILLQMQKTTLTIVLGNTKVDRKSNVILFSILSIKKV
jgi:hypothetical protein